MLAQNLVTLLEDPQPGRPTWQTGVEGTLQGILDECGVKVPKPTARDPKAPDAAVCPKCGADPVRFTINQGAVPTDDEHGTHLLIAQIWCTACKVLLTMQIMGVLPGAQTPADDLGAGSRKPQLWKPS